MFSKRFSIGFAAVAVVCGLTGYVEAREQAPERSRDYTQGPTDEAEAADACERVVQGAGQPVADPPGWAWCEARSPAAAYCVRFDREGGYEVRLRGLSRRRLAPRQPIDVVVVAPADRQIEMRVCDGQMPIEAGPRLVARSGPMALIEGEPQPKEESPPPALRVHRERFFPTRAGVITAQVGHRAHGGGGFETDDGLTRRFKVEQTHSVGIHVGFGAILPPAVDQRYVVKRRNGSQQAEVFAQSNAGLGLELVLGFTPYLGEGRPVSGCQGWGCVTPFFGVGVVAAGQEDKLDWIKGIHVGASVELSSAFSVAVTGAFRRVDVLSKDVELGSPYDMGSDDYQTSSMRMGLGVVFSFTPDVLRSAFDQAKKVMGEDEE